MTKVRSVRPSFKDQLGRCRQRGLWQRSKKPPLRGAARLVGEGGRVREMTKSLEREMTKVWSVR